MFRRRVVGCCRQQTVRSSQNGGRTHVEYGSEKFTIDLKPGGQYTYLID